MASDFHGPHQKSNGTRTRVQRFQHSTRRNSESLGVALTVISAWVVEDVLQYNVPMEVMGAIWVVCGIVVARIRDAGE